MLEAYELLCPWVGTLKDLLHLLACYSYIDGFHGTSYHGKWRHYITMLPGDWSISISRPFCPPVSMVKNAMESMYSYFVQCMSGSKGLDMQKE